MAQLRRVEGEMGVGDLLGGLVADRYRLSAARPGAGTALRFEALDEQAHTTAAVWLWPCAPGARAAALLHAPALRRQRQAYLLGYRDLQPLDDGGVCYLAAVTEPLGESLRDRLDRDGALNLNAAAALGTALSSALVALHRDGLVHGALSVDHVFWTGNGWSLGGFGVAELLGEPAGPPADLAALGALLLLALTGQTADLPGALPTPWRRLLHRLGSGDPSLGAAEVLRGLTSPESELTPAPEPDDAPNATWPAVTWPASWRVRLDRHLVKLLLVWTMALVLSLVATAMMVDWLINLPRTVATQRMSTCQTNLRRIGVATQQYAQDWDDRLPCPLPAQGQSARLQLTPYLPDDSVWRCPSQRGTGPHYFYCAPSELRLSHIGSPSMLGIHGEGRSLAEPVFPHNDGSQVGWADGHVYWVPSHEFSAPRILSWYDAKPPTR